MKTVYACTYVEKIAEEDDFERGCQIGSAVCCMSEKVNIQADKLPNLVKAVGEQFGLEMHDLFISEDEGELVPWFGFNRLETVNGYEPTERELREWEQGLLTLYVADYNFAVEKRLVENISREEFERTGIKTH